MEIRDVRSTSRWEPTEKGGYRLKKAIKVEPINMDIEQSKELLDEESINAIEQARREEENQKDKLRRQVEVSEFAKKLLKAMNGLSLEEILAATTKMIANEDAFEKVVRIYAKTETAEKHHYDQVIVVRNALSSILESTSLKIEQSHREFTVIEPAKTTSR